MIARFWSGTVRTEDAAEYVEYVRETGFTEYGETPGNRGAWLLRRDGDDGTTEILTMSVWDDTAAIRAFAGDDIEAAVFYPEDECFLVDKTSTRIAHYEVAGHIADRSR
jgi:heme-degrading monooxygenase HmoA